MKGIEDFVSMTFLLTPCSTTGAFHSLQVRAVGTMHRSALAPILCTANHKNRMLSPRANTSLHTK